MNLPIFGPLGYTQRQHFFNQVRLLLQLLEYGEDMYPQKKNEGYE